jgi:hypothetical protein
MSKRQGPPKHQNRYAWKPNLGQKINETVSPRAASLSFFILFFSRPESHGWNPRRCRSPAAGSVLCRRSPASASAARTKSTGREGRESPSVVVVNLSS